MAVNFAGSACSSKIMGDSSTSVNVWAIENEIDSHVAITVRRLSVQLDFLALLNTGAMPQIKTLKGTGAIANGGCIRKCPFDSVQTSSEEVHIWVADSSDNGSSSTASLTLPNSPTPIWQQMATRLHTAYGQILADDTNQVPLLCAKNAFPYIILPGEYLGINISPTVGTANPQGYQYIVNCVWFEETLETYQITGNVTLSGAGVVGAKVNVIIADDTSLTNSRFWETVTTGALGAWSSNIPIGKIAYAYAQNYTGGIYYTSVGNPYVS